MMRMEEVVPEASESSLQHLITDGVWDHRAVFGQVRRDADRLLGGHADSCLIIDESAMEKKGRCSAGVARQWNGHRGKVDNCQVGVFAALAQGHRAALVDARLYLPKAWTDDADRCAKAKIPEAERGFRSKSEIALEMIAEAKTAGVRFACVLADGGYGKEPSFLRGVEDQGLRFLVEVHKNQRIFLADPQIHIPERAVPHGRPPSRLVTDMTATSVEAWAAGLPAQVWSEIEVRHTSQGMLRVRAAMQRVFCWDGSEAKPRCWTVLVVQDPGENGDIHYALTNQPGGTTLDRLVRFQRQRFWVEHAFGEAKAELGLDEYEVRTWHGWHRHAALTCMALVFLVEERLLHQDDLPLLSARDIRDLVASLLPRNDQDPDSVIASIAHRHRYRAEDINRRYAAQDRERPHEAGGNLAK